MSNSTLWTTLPEANARFDTRWDNPWTPHLEGTKTLYGQFVRYWVAIDATLAPALIDTLLATSTYDGVTAPYADGHLYPGLHAVSDAWSESDGEHAVRVYEKLTRVSAITTTADLPTPEIMGAEDILDKNGLQSGTSDIRMFKFTHLSPASREACLLTIPDATLQTFLNTTYPVAEKTMTLDSRRWDIEPKGDRTGTLLVTVSLQTWTNTNITPTTGGYQVGFEGMNTQHLVAAGQEGTHGHQYAVRTEYPGIPTSQVVAKAATLRDTSETTFGVAEVVARIGSQGDSTITTQKEKANLDDVVTLAADTGFTLALLDERSRTPELGYNRIRIYWPNLPNSVADAWVAIIKGWLSFTYATNTYSNGGQSITRHKSGLATVYLSGVVSGASGNSSVNRDWTVHDEAFFYQAFEASDLSYGGQYRITYARRVCTAWDDAKAWANTSSQTQPANNQKGHKGGKITWNETYEVFEAIAEWWEAEDSYGIPATWESLQTLLGGKALFEYVQGATA